MCVIVDANIAPLVFSTPAAPEFKPVLRWIKECGGIIATGGKNKEELLRIGAARNFIQEALRQPRNRRYVYLTQEDPSREDPVDREEKALLKQEACKSDDPHVIALARVSGARTLCSHDQALHADFTNPELLSDPRGKVYQQAEHAHLLAHTPGCPAANKHHAPLWQQKHKK
jgi:hypothetical protein